MFSVRDVCVEYVSVGGLACLASNVGGYGEGVVSRFLCFAWLVQIRFGFKGRVLLRGATSSE